MRQPKYFFKSTEDNQKLSVAATTREEGKEEILPNNPILARKLPFSSKVMLGVGITSLALLASLGSLPGILKSKALPLIFPESGNAILLEQKGGIGIHSGLQFDARVQDGRAEIVAGFLSRYNSPLKPAEEYGQMLVAAADRYGLDYRLLPAIMMQESNLCKASDPAIHNCLGFGIHKGGTLAFDSYEESFDRAARELKERYIDIGLVTPEQIMTKYTPSSNGSWAKSVNQWIAEMEYNSRTRGLDSEEDMDLTAYSSKN